MLFVDACCDVSLFVLLIQIYITTNCQQYCVLFASKYLICLDAISDTEIATTIVRMRRLISMFAVLMCACVCVCVYLNLCIAYIRYTKEKRIRAGEITILLKLQNKIRYRNGI